MRALSISDPIELSHHCGGEVPIDPAALGREQAFAEGEDLRGKAEVDRELEEERLAIRADVGNGLAKLAEQGQSHRERLEVAPDHDDQGSRLCLGDAAQQRSVEHRCAKLAHPSRELDAGLTTDRAHVDVQLAWPERGEDPVRPLT
jgi:hypothetical protein